MRQKSFVWRASATPNAHQLERERMEMNTLRPADQFASALVPIHTLYPLGALLLDTGGVHCPVFGWLVYIYIYSVVEGGALCILFALGRKGDCLTVSPLLSRHFTK
jgi:hypothetical protein